MACWRSQSLWVVSPGLHAMTVSTPSELFPSWAVQWIHPCLQPRSVRPPTMWNILVLLWLLSSQKLALHECPLSRVWLFVTLWTVVHQAPLSMELSRQEYWSGLQSPPPRDLPKPGTGLNPSLLCLWHWQLDSLPLVPPGKRKWR